MGELINVIKKDLKIRIKTNDMLNRYNRLPYNYQSKIGYDTLIQNVILKELINIMGTTITDLDIESKMKNSRIKYLENKTIYMEECNICLTIKKKRSRNRHEQSKKHKYFSNLITNKYIVRNPEIINFKDIIQPYYDKHKKKFDNFSLCVMWKRDDVIINKISVPSTITLEKPFLFKPRTIELPLVVRVSPIDFLNTFGRNINNENDEIDIIFTPDLNDMTFSHYLAQPKSMLCRKLVRNFIGKDFVNFDYN